MKRFINKMNLHQNMDAAKVKSSGPNLGEVMQAVTDLPSVIFRADNRVLQEGNLEARMSPAGTGRVQIFPKDGTDPACTSIAVPDPSNTVSLWDDSSVTFTYGPHSFQYELYINNQQ